MAIGQSTKYLTTRTVFSVTLVVTVLTVTGIWLFGLGQHRSMYDNSLLSATILSIAFFLFLAIGLYNGVKLKDNIGKLTDKLEPSKIPDFSKAIDGPAFLGDGEGIGEILIAIFLWIVVAILIALFLWLFGAILWTSIIVFIAMLYWIFFRAVRLVFKNSNKCRGNLKSSIAYGLFYMIIYNCWIYAIIFGTHYLIG